MMCLRGSEIYQTRTNKTQKKFCGSCVDDQEDVEDNNYKLWFFEILKKKSKYHGRNLYCKVV